MSRWSVSTVLVGGQTRFQVVVDPDPLPPADARALASYLDRLCSMADDAGPEEIAR